jgi:hypothetical protein
LSYLKIPFGIRKKRKKTNPNLVSPVSLKPNYARPLPASRNQPPPPIATPSLPLFSLSQALLSLALSLLSSALYRASLSRSRAPLFPCSRCQAGLARRPRVELPARRPRHPARADRPLRPARHPGSLHVRWRVRSIICYVKDHQCFRFFLPHYSLVTDACDVH